MCYLKNTLVLCEHPVQWVGSKHQLNCARQTYVYLVSFAQVKPR